MLDNRHYILVADYDLLDLFRAHHVLLSNFGALLHVLKKGHIPFAIAAAGTREHHKLENLLDATVNLHWLRSIATTLNCARPAALHFDAVLTEEGIARCALKRHWAYNKFAKTTDEKVGSGRHSRRFIYLA